eukprot:12242410-Ditylum_brightwellii.AAC.1
MHLSSAQECLLVYGWACARLSTISLATRPTAAAHTGGRRFGMCYASEKEYLSNLAHWNHPRWSRTAFVSSITSVLLALSNPFGRPNGSKFS